MKKLAQMTPTRLQPDCLLCLRRSCDPAALIRLAQRWEIASRMRQRCPLLVRSSERRPPSGLLHLRRALSRSALLSVASIKFFPLLLRHLLERILVIQQVLQIRRTSCQYLKKRMRRPYHRRHLDLVEIAQRRHCPSPTTSEPTRTAKLRIRSQ